MFWSPQTARGRRCIGVIAATWLCAFTFAAPSLAHVALDTPKSGLTLEVGSTVVVTWEDTILHDGIGYDLDLIGADAHILGPVVHDLPTNVHSYDWLVPDVWCVGCYLMVTQVNRDHNYSDSVLVNIYGTPAVESSGGAGGSANGGSSNAGGASASPNGNSSGGRGGSAGHASAGASGTLTVSSAGSAGMSAGDPANPAPAGSSSGGRGPSGAPTESTSGSKAMTAGGSASVDPDSAGVDAENAGADNALAGAPAADAAAGEASNGPVNSGGCAIDLRAPSPFTLGLSAAGLAIVLARRKRRTTRRDD